MFKAASSEIPCSRMSFCPFFSRKEAVVLFVVSARFDGCSRDTVVSAISLSLNFLITAAISALVWRPQSCGSLYGNQTANVNHTVNAGADEFGQEAQWCEAQQWGLIFVWLYQANKAEMTSPFDLFLLQSSEHRCFNNGVVKFKTFTNFFDMVNPSVFFFHYTFWY